jgi:hypothetical protein
VNLSRVSLFGARHSRTWATASQDAEKMVQLCHSEAEALTVLVLQPSEVYVHQGRITSISLLSPPSQMD